MPGSLRWAMASGRMGARSSLQSQTDETDFGALSVPITTGVQVFTCFAMAPVQTVSLQMGGPEAYGDGTAKLAASDATRSIGVWPGMPLGVAAGFELLSLTIATGAFKAYAATLSLQLILISASDTGGPGIVNNLMAALALNTIAFPWTPLTLTVPAARQVLRPDTGVAIANAFAYFAGDTVVAKFSNTGGSIANIAQGDVMGLSWELF
jgi:hypothetical protein